MNRGGWTRLSSPQSYRILQTWRYDVCNVAISFIFFRLNQCLQMIHRHVTLTSHGHRGKLPLLICDDHLRWCNNFHLFGIRSYKKSAINGSKKTIKTLHHPHHPCQATEFSNFRRILFVLRIPQSCSLQGSLLWSVPSTTTSTVTVIDPLIQLASRDHCQKPYCLHMQQGANHQQAFAAILNGYERIEKSVG